MKKVFSFCLKKWIFFSGRGVDPPTLIGDKSTFNYALPNKRAKITHEKYLSKMSISELSYTCPKVGETDCRPVDSSHPNVFIKGPNIKIYALIPFRQYELKTQYVDYFESKIKPWLKQIHLRSLYAHSSHTVCFMLLFLLL